LIPEFQIQNVGREPWEALAYIGGMSLPAAPMLFESETPETGVPASAPPFDLRVRVGCRLVYDASQPVLVVLGIRPQREAGHRVEAERLTIGGGLPVEAFTDLHGNVVDRVLLPAGTTEIQHDALVAVTAEPDNARLPQTAATPPALLPPELLRYVLPSRYGDSDRLLNFAWEKFGAVPHGRGRVQAICDWLHANIEYRFGSGRPDLSAWDILQRGYGVCRDFAHLGVALCRTFNLPARYLTGHLPDIGFVDPGSPMDFHAYFQVYLDGAWLTFDPRFNVPRIGRIKVAAGLDAVDTAFTTAYGALSLRYFEVWAYQVAPDTVAVGDPLDLSKRLDGDLEIRKK
jgi:transglutaminase-like putative cysteine protease